MHRPHERHPGRLRGAVTRPWRCVPELAAAAATAALLLEWTVRDAVPLVATAWYASPLPVVAAALLVGTALAVVRGRIVPALLCGALLAACVATHRAVAILPERPTGPAGEEPIRGLLWNAWRARPGLDRAIREIRRHDPDLFVLVEPPVDAQAEPLVALRELMPGYSFGFVERHFVVAARGDVQVSGRIDIEGGNAARATVTVGERDLELLCVDLRSSPLRHRRGPLAGIARRAAPLADGAALVLGDFNTPRRSVHFWPLRARWTHAFEAAGTGHDATWPEPVPVHSIDHVWGSRVRFTGCRIVPTELSDHRMVVFSLSR